MSDLFVIIFDHKNLRVMWRGSVGDGSSDDLVIPPDHDGLDVLNSAGFEWIARRCYSIERVLVETQSLSQAYALLEIYDAALLKEPPLKLQQRRRLRRRKHALMRSKRKVGRA